MRGTLVFGVDTAANNQLTGSRILRIDQAGHFPATMRGTDGVELPMSFLVGRFPGAGERGVFASAAMAGPADVVASPTQARLTTGFPSGL